MLEEKFGGCGEGEGVCQEGVRGGWVGEERFRGGVVRQVFEDGEDFGVFAGRDEDSEVMGVDHQAVAFEDLLRVFRLAPGQDRAQFQEVSELEVMNESG